MAVKAVQVFLFQRRAGLVQRRGGNAGGQHEPHVHREALRGLEHIGDAVGPHDVGNFMGVRYHRGGAVGQHRPGEFRRGHQGALQVNVGIHESREDQFSGAVPLFPAGVGPQAGDESLCHGNIRRQDLPGKDVGIRCIF